MITKKRFYQIHQEVKEAVAELFDYANKKSQDYILFLADAEYHPEYAKTRFSPYVISDRIDYYKEVTRLDFFTTFLNQNYSFDGVRKTTDTPSRVIVELMIYSHIWESTKFIKQLYRLKELTQGRSYPWEIDVIPEASKHSFIRKDIRDGFKKTGLTVASVMSSGFHSSLRNSFMHGEFEIDQKTLDIKLHTYRIPRNLLKHELDQITVSSWTEYFVYSVLFNYLFMIEKESRRSAIPKDFGRTDFLVIHPKKRTSPGVRFSFGVRKIFYDSSRNSFSFYQSDTPYIPAKKVFKTKVLKRTPKTIRLSKREFKRLESHISAGVTQVFDTMEKAAPLQYNAFLLDITKNNAGVPTVPTTIPELNRLEFSGKFLGSTYIKPAAHLREMMRIQLEMLIYTHAWESKVLMKQLQTGIQIIEKSPVHWNYEFPEDRRELMEDLIARYKAKNMYLGAILEFAFHTSLRNAFAHSDYVIENDKIYLDTYKEDRSWDIPDITINEWTHKFVTSVMIDHYFYINKEKRKAKLTLQTISDTVKNV